MTCDELNGLLDALMDGEASESQRQEMTAHACGCPQCAAALRSTLQLKALFDQMEPEADVPLEAQARWRGAVREAAVQRRRMRLIRWIGSAAAALVVLVGIGVAINMRGAPTQSVERAMVASEAGPAMAAATALPREAVESKAISANEAVNYAEALGAVIEADGSASGYEAVELEEACEEAVDADYAVPPAAAAGRQAPACELTLSVADVDTACSRIEDLAQEYECAADVQRLEDGGANVYVEIASADADDFLSAVAPMSAGDEPAGLPELSGDGTVLLLLAIQQAK